MNDWDEYDIDFDEYDSLDDFTDDFDIYVDWPTDFWDDLGEWVEGIYEDYDFDMFEKLS